MKKLTAAMVAVAGVAFATSASAATLDVSKQKVTSSVASARAFRASQTLMTQVNGPVLTLICAGLLPLPYLVTQMP